eukprot:7349405-Pyramimonas_sp.AAC.1
MQRALTRYTHGGSPRLALRGPSAGKTCGHVPGSGVLAPPRPAEPGRVACAQLPASTLSPGLKDELP